MPLHLVLHLFAEAGALLIDTHLLDTADTDTADTAITSRKIALNS